jgi:hypothetical protein
MSWRCGSIPYQGPVTLAKRVSLLVAVEPVPGNIPGNNIAQSTYIQHSWALQLKFSSRRLHILNESSQVTLAFFMSKSAIPAKFASF